MVDEKIGDSKFVHGVRSGLAAQPKSLSPIFFYDALGSHLFDAICDLRQFAHRAIWNEGHSRMEMYLVSLRAQTVQIPGADLTVRFEADEAILTEHSYKFTPVAIHSLVEQAGLQLSAEWRHESGFLNAIYRNSRI